MTQTVHVLLPVHNRRELTLRFLACLREQTYDSVHLVVIDDGSTDGTARDIRATHPSATVLEGDGSWWWAGCLQHGFDWLLGQDLPDSDLVLIGNDDTAFERDYVERAVTFLASRSRCLLGSQFRDPVTGIAGESGVEADLRRFTFRLAPSPDRINCLSTRGLYLRWRDMKVVGGFHPRLLPHYWSDYEYTLRAHKKGFALLTDPSVALIADLATTGYHDLDALVGWNFVRHLFSIKTPLNPIHRTAFVLLASAGLWKVINVANVWGRALTRLLWQGVIRRPFPRTRSGFVSSAR